MSHNKALDGYRKGLITARELANYTREWINEENVDLYLGALPPEAMDIIVQRVREGEKDFDEPWISIGFAMDKTSDQLKADHILMRDWLQRRGLLEKQPKKGNGQKGDR
jgi:hypothetical protein